MFRWTIEYQQLANHQSHVIKNASCCPLSHARNLHDLCERLWRLQAASDGVDLLCGWHSVLLCFLDQHRNCGTESEHT